jgi:hypothetical protein
VNRFLQLAPEDRARAFEQAAVNRGLPPASVEKDFWVCLVLRELFDLPEYGPHLTFKGGTSLSKAWGLIDRFSEDIDLTIGRDALGFGGENDPQAAGSRNEQRRRIEKLKAACRDVVVDRIAPEMTARMIALLPAEKTWRILPDPDDPDSQTLLFAYPRHNAENTPSYVKPIVKLEFGARSDPWPVEARQVTSIAAEELPRQFDIPACTVQALLPERTFLEKVMLLHEERFRPADRTRRPRMARHYYDVWRLIQLGVAARAIDDSTLFEQVAAHREVYFRQSWVNYATLRRGTIEMLPLPGQLDEWRRDYSAMQGEMFVGTPPTFEEILAAIEKFQSELK